MSEGFPELCLCLVISKTPPHKRSLDLWRLCFNMEVSWVMGVPPNHPSHGWPWLSIQTNGDPMVTWGSPMTYDPSMSVCYFRTMIPSQKVQQLSSRPWLFHPSLDDRLLTLFFGIETPLVSKMSYNQSLYLWWWTRQIIRNRHPGWHQPYSFSGSNCARCHIPCRPCFRWDHTCIPKCKIHFLVI